MYGNEDTFDSCKQFWAAHLGHEPMQRIYITWQPTFSRGFGLTRQSASFIGAFWSYIADAVQGRATISASLKRISIKLSSISHCVQDLTDRVKKVRTDEAALSRVLAEGDMRTSNLLNVMGVDYEGNDRHRLVGLQHSLLRLKLPRCAVISAPREFPEAPWCDAAIAAACGRALRLLFNVASIDCGDLEVPATEFQAEMMEDAARARNLISEVAEPVWIRAY